MDQSSAGLGHRTPGPEASLCLHMFMGGQRTCFALRGFLSLALTLHSRFRFYLCLFSGPSAFLPKVRDSEFMAHVFGVLFLRGGLSTCWKGSGLGARPSGVGQVGCKTSKAI